MARLFQDETRREQLKGKPKFLNVVEDSRGVHSLSVPRDGRVRYLSTDRNKGCSDGPRGAEGSTIEPF